MRYFKHTFLLTFPVAFKALSAVCLLLLLGLQSGCSEGEGGTASITGLITVQEFDIYGNVFDEYPALDQRVYIVYGDDEVFNDEVRTSFNGKFRFDFLRKGSYTVFVYSDCNACPGEKEAIVQELELGGGEKLDLGTLLIRNN
jgi:hypothetical protein